MPKKPHVKVLSTYELMQMFPDEQSAVDYLTGILWPQGPVCPHCQSKQITTLQRKNYYRCRDCDKVFTIRTDTVFEKSHIPLHKWLYAMYLIVTARKGVSSLQLSKELGITQKSACGSLSNESASLAATKRRNSFPGSSRQTRRTSVVSKRTSTRTKS